MATLRLKDVMDICEPDWLKIKNKIIDCSKKDIKEHLDLPIEQISGWDDGITITLLHGSSPTTCLPVKGRDKRQ